MGCVLSQHDELGKKQKQSTTLARNFLTLNLVIPLWKQLVALVWETQRLRHYMLYHAMLLISRIDPLKYFFEKPALSGSLVCWHLLSAESDITYVKRKSK